MFSINDDEDGARLQWYVREDSDRKFDSYLTSSMSTWTQTDMCFNAILQAWRVKRSVCYDFRMVFLELYIVTLHIC